MKDIVELQLHESTGVIKCKSRLTVLLIFAPQVYANFQPWRTPEELLALRESFTECIPDCSQDHAKDVPELLYSRDNNKMPNYQNAYFNPEVYTQKLLENHSRNV